jgi:2-polyprenyl-6-methoxyphenol hydroxylase-like FAD-dependent oxidoreductase
MRVIVVGAGLGGLTAAIALRARGFDVVMFEAAPRSRIAGGGLGIASNATKVLSALGVDLAKAGVGRVCERLELRTARGRPIRELPLPSIAEELGSPIVNVRHADLIALLRDCLADTPIHYGIEVVRHDRLGDGVSITCADGRTRVGDVLIGADGIHSVVRAQLTGPEPVNDYRHVCWTATVPFEHPRLPPGAAAHYWGSGQRFALIDIGDGHACWWGTKNARPRHSRLWTGAKEEILRCFAGWAEEVCRAIWLTPAADILTVPAQDRAFLESWGDGPVTLVGDAAHPMLTSLSQGAGSAIEDGYALAHHLAAEGDAVTALRRYEDERRDRARWLVTASRRLSRLEQMGNPITARLRNLALQLAPMSTVRHHITTSMEYDLPT